MLSNPRVSLLVVVWLSFAAMLWSEPAQAQAEKKEDPDRARAMQLTRELKMLEALPLLERLYQADPKDAKVGEALAQALVTKSATVDPAERSKGLIRAREILLKLQDQGVELSDLSKFYVTYIPPDGKWMAFSGKGEVDEAMRQGEAEFAQRNFDKARVHYLRAVALDPKNETAALFVGDTYFAANNPKEAARWFERSAKIKPDYTAAWRYWGDALTRQGKQTEARDKFCEAVLTAPYTMDPWMSLGQWARANKIPIAHPRVMPLDLTPKTARPPRVEDGTTHVSLYAKRRDDWKIRRFSLRFPKEKAYRHTLAEEADALRSVAKAVLADKAAGKIKTLDPDLASLLNLEAAGLLEAYVLLARPDEGIAQDFDAYRTDHADKLLTYLKTYVVPVGIYAK